MTADTPRQDRVLGLPREKIGGRFVTAYAPEVALQICEAVSEGKTLVKICAPDSGMPARQTFHRWVVQQPELARAYAAARELSGHALEEEALDAGREVRSNPGTSQNVRAFEVLMNQLRWSASKRNPRVYSERAAIVATVPIQINTTLDMGEAGTAGGTIEHPNIYSLELTAKVVEQPAVLTEELAAEAMQRGDTVFTGKPQDQRFGPKPFKRRKPVALGRLAEETP